MATKVTTIRQRIVVPAEPAAVYDAFMDAKKHAAFTGSKATSDAKISGKFTAWDGYISGKNLEFEKGKKIVQEWVTTEWPKDYAPSRLELTLKRVKGGTEISMVQSDVPSEQAEELKEGWTEFYWKPLKDYFKKERGTSKK
ncbi:MAG TPA: SRPBCC domain-containing protein [Candidatus Eisenbacteria bacterium]|nr:SRPBCC domain-containing protein [Candidatus Eisenbacteria bacterium]